MNNTDTSCHFDASIIFFSVFGIVSEAIHKKNIRPPCWLKAQGKEAAIGVVLWQISDE